MLLFRGDFGCVLHTGDFRWEVGCEKARMAKEMLGVALKEHDGDVDVVYLDNTYANPTYDFPTRSVAAQQVIDIISSHPDHDVIIGINNYGKEDLLLQISRAFDIEIWVSPQRLQTMHLLGLPDVFTTDTTVTRVRAVPMYSFSRKTLEGLNLIRPTIGILPSGLPWVKKSLKKNEFLSGSFLTSGSKRSRCDTDSTQVQMDKKIDKTGSPKMFDKYIFSVPYSDHSNCAELEDFIKLVKPSSLKGIVSSSTCYIEPMYYFGRLCTGNQPAPMLHNVEDVNVELDRNISKESYLLKGSGKRVVTINPETSFEDDNVELDRNRYRRKTSKMKLGSRMTKYRKRRGVKFLEHVEE